MAKKEIKYAAQAREKMMKGVDTLANAVKVCIRNKNNRIYLIHNQFYS